MQSIAQNYRKLSIYRKRNFKFDILSAIVVFLVAIPLCLGIALASKAPPLAGILSGIIGGIVVGGLSGSSVSVSGPAAGLVAVVLSVLLRLGDFNTFLLALTMAGLFQIIIGALRAGFIADYVPSNVIQGLLCAIGILLIIKQLQPAFSLDHNLHEVKHHLINGALGFALEDFYIHIDLGAAFISCFSLVVLIFFEKTRISWLKSIPGPIVVVISGIIINQILVFNDSILQQEGIQLVNIPHFTNFSEFAAQLSMPSWHALGNPQVYICGLIIALVASLETLLNINAAEKLDRKRRSVSKDRELIAQGIGNLFAGLIGGIPITSVVVRSSVNIQAGARTKFSTVLHGILLLIFVALLSSWLNEIPLSCLAAILIYTGYKLNKPKIYVAVYNQGMERFIPFVITLVGIVGDDLLTGIIMGLLASLFFTLRSNSLARLDIIKEYHSTGMTHRLVLPQQTSFLNKASLIAELKTIPKNAQLIIDARYTDYIDKEIIEFIKEFKEDAHLKPISLNLLGFKEHYDIHNYIDFINVTNYDVQSNISPASVLHILCEGNLRFVHDRRIHRCLKTDLHHTAEKQHPLAVVLGCIDSRVPVETIFDVTLGDLFCIRVAGNVVNEDVIASMEFACHFMGAKLIVVLGHTRCGAIQAACDGIQEGHITQLLEKMTPAINAEHAIKTDRHGKNEAFVNHVTSLNVGLSLEHIYTQSDILKNMVRESKIGMVGAIYDVHTGIVSFNDFSTQLPTMGGVSNDPLKEDLHRLLVDAKQGDG